MKLSDAWEAFAKCYSLLGPVAWVLSIQYFLVQLVVASAWTQPYSVAHNTISDLGNTTCSSSICSPLHGLMNASFILLGVCMIAGSILIYKTFKKNPIILIGFSCMAIAGIGTMIVGIFPENTISSLHTFGATLPFLIGNVGLLILGFGLIIPKPLRIYTLLSGLVPLIALVFFVTHSYLGIGQGGIERIAAYPQTLWLIVFGMYMSLHFRGLAGQN